jgi:hypothetical protein
MTCLPPEATSFDWSTFCALAVLFAGTFGPIFYMEWRRPPSEFDSHF